MMQDYLQQVIKRLPDLLLLDDWNSLYIDYEKPIVERLWRQDGDNRIYLHYLHECSATDEVLFHPHPWPSAIAVLDGTYEMGLGYGHDSGLESPPLATTLIAKAPFKYQMPDPDAWHYVNPHTDCISVMVTGKPFEPRRESYKSDYQMRELTVKEISDMKRCFKLLIRIVNNES